MKKRLLFLTVLVVALVAMLAISASAAVIYKTADGDELFRYTTNSNGIIEAYEGEFPRVNDENEALTWYVTATTTVEADTIKTVASFVTTDSTYSTVTEAGQYSYKGVDRLNIVSANFPEGITSLNLVNDSYGWSGNNPNLLFLYFPSTMNDMEMRLCQATPVIACEFHKDSTFPTLGVTAFYDCKNLREIFIPVSVTKIGGNDGYKQNGSAFYNCQSLTNVVFGDVYADLVVNEDGTSNGLTLEGGTFACCYALEKIVLPNRTISIGPRAFEYASSLKEIRFGSSLVETVKVSIVHVCNEMRYYYIPSTWTTVCNHTFSQDGGFGPADRVFFYAGTKEQFDVFMNAARTSGNNQRLTSITEDYIIEWDSTKDDQYYKDLAKNNNKGYVVYNYNKCKAFYENEHDLGEINSCMAVATCDRKCGFSVTPDFEGHSVVETLVYANGFGEAGVYSCVCSNAEYCTAIEGYALNETKDPIITFKGYSNPETEAYLGINVGYFVDTLLLSEYTRITGESVTIGLFMVNGDIDVADIIDGKTLELADGAKGFSVKVINLNYSSISIEVRGFSKTGETEGSLGNYYTLKLVSAVVVTTTKGENTATHFIQAGVDGADLETKTFNGFDFYLITADAVYGTPES